MQFQELDVLDRSLTLAALAAGPRGFGTLLDSWTTARMFNLCSGDRFCGGRLLAAFARRRRGVGEQRWSAITRDPACIARCLRRARGGRRRSIAA